MTDIEEKKNIDETKDSMNYEDLDFGDFDDFLCEPHDGVLLKGVYAFGFEKPSLIQAKTILPIYHGKDVLAQAQSGSGKTGAFGIGILTRINPAEKYPQAVILADTRGLAEQIAYVVGKIGASINVKVSLCIGGKTSSGGDVTSNLNDAYTSHILIGTPGRVLDLIGRDDHSRGKSFKLLDRIKIFVLDEADNLLSENFEEQIQQIVGKIPKDSQICLFSATYPYKILKLTEHIFLTEPVKILLDEEKISVDTIKNYYVNVEYEENKYAVLVELYQKVSVCQAVIFVNFIKTAVGLAKALTDNGHTVGLIHSDLTDIERSEILKSFRLTQIRILVATDIISRGIDVQQVGLVINYDIPQSTEQYIHRVGRSGRFGKSGTAITFVTNHKSDVFRMQNIEKKHRIKFHEMPDDLGELNRELTGINGYNFVKK